MISRTKEVITQECECCHTWVNQMDLVWDLGEERLVCGDCFNEREEET